jgi:PAS domain S-box-containing protein
LPTERGEHTVVGEREGNDVQRDEVAGTVAGTAESLLTFENAALPLSVIHPNGSIIMVNRAMRRLLRYDSDELAGRPMYDLIADDAGEFADAWEQRITSGQRVTPERRMRLRCGDASEITVRASSVLVTDGQGAVRYIVARAVLDRH